VDGGGSLDVYELRKVLKTLVGKLGYQELDKFCKEIDKSGDGQVSFKEFSEWVLHGPQSEKLMTAVKAETGEKRLQRIRDVFNRYDKSGDGSLDISELEVVLKALGAFANSEIVTVTKDLDTSKDGQVSFEEFAAWVQIGYPKCGKVPAKAKAILAPADDDGLEAIFYCYCSTGRCEMDIKSFSRILKDAGFIDERLTPTMLELIFNHTSVKPRGNKFIDFCQFDVGLEMVAERRNQDKDTICAKLLDLTNPVLCGTRADYCRFHDDKSAYTGSHKYDRAALPGGGGTGHKLGEKITKPPGSAATKMSSSSSSWMSNSSRSVMKYQCTSLAEPGVDNSQLYKKFGLGTPMAKMLRKVYAKEEQLHKRRQGRESPRAIPIRAPSSKGPLRKVASLPVLHPRHANDNTLLISLRRCQFSHNPPNLWTSPFLQRLQEEGGTSLRSLHCLPKLDSASELESPGRCTRITA